MTFHCFRHEARPGADCCADRKQLLLAVPVMELKHIDVVRVSAVLTAAAPHVDQPSLVPFLALTLIAEERSVAPPPSTVADVGPVPERLRRGIAGSERRAVQTKAASIQR